MISRTTAACWAALVFSAGPVTAQAGIVFTPHLSEYSLLPAGQYSEFTFITTEIENVYDREGKTVHVGAPFIPAGDSVDATLLLYKSLWIGNLFRDTRVPILNTHPQFCTSSACSATSRPPAPPYYVT